MSPRFSVLLAVHRPPDLLPHAIESVLAQTVSDFELLVVCDGAPEETVACARAFATRDARVKAFAFPKGERHGEAHRHAVLAQATGQLVAHIADDDLWFPDHLAEMEILLATADFGNLIHTHIWPNGEIEALACDLADPTFRRRFVEEKFNRFGPTFCGYRMDAYRRLPEGWSPAPPDVLSDLHMWRKFLGRDDIKAATRASITAIHFAAAARTDMPPEERLEENTRWSRRIQDPAERRAITEAAFLSLGVKCIRHERDALAASAALDALRASSQSELARASEALHTVETRLARIHAGLATAQVTLQSVMNSRSWRWTAPLRALLAPLRRS